jgi:diguanylate cyclase (GGDEF)-like protein
VRVQTGATAPPRPLSIDALPHVLVVDPDPAEGSRVCEILRANGFTPRTAESAEEILTAKVATVLLSLDGGGEERLDLIRALRRLGPNRPAIVLMSGRGQTLLARALDAGADDYLTIPTGTEELLARLRVVGRRRRIEAEQVMLRRVAENVATGGVQSRLFGFVARELALLLDADGGRVVRYLDAGRAQLLGGWRRTDDAQIVPGEVLALVPSWVLAQVQRTEEPVRSGLTEAEAQRAEDPVAVALAAPVRVEGSLWGAVAVAYSEAGAAREEALGQLERVADLISLAVSSADAREHLARLARTDPLTGLLNYGAFHHRLDQEVRRTARHDRPLSLALLDIDHFKQVNDRHGHRAGDDALRTVAELAKSHLRETDVLGRVGGEELAWLMPESDLAGAALAAERLCASIAATPIAHVGGVTASIGVAQLAVDRSAGDLYGAADAAMYRAKRAGRNQVKLA